MRFAINAEVRDEGNTSLHIFIPTVGRTTIFHMLASLRNELKEQDFLTVAFDGQDQEEIFDKVENAVTHLPGTGRVLMVNDTVSQERHEHALRNRHTSSTVEGNFCMFADDDDQYVEGFAQNVRAAVSIDPRGLYFFRMYRHRYKDTIWADPELYVSNIGTPNGVIPCDLLGLSQWGHGYAGDGEYFIDLASKFPRYYFVDHVIYHVGQEW